MIASGAKLARSFAIVVAAAVSAAELRIQKNTCRQGRRQLQPCRMPGYETARRPIGRLPTRRPPIGTAVPGRRIQAQPGDHGKGMSIARINRDPLPAPAASKAAQIAGTHRRSHQSCGPKNVRNCPGTIITGIQKRLMASAVSIRPGTKLVGCPDGSFHRWRSLSRCPGQSVTEDERWLPELPAPRRETDSPRPLE